MTKSHALALCLSQDGDHPFVQYNIQYMLRTYQSLSARLCYQLDCCDLTVFVFK
jgi:hypothetical protein